mgnify:FL=1
MLDLNVQKCYCNLDAIKSPQTKGQSMNKEKLARLKAERKSLSLRVVERIATKAEKMRLTMIRDEIRRLERYANLSGQISGNG